MEFGLALSAAQLLFAALQSSELKEVWSIMGYKSELDELNRTVVTVKAVLQDAETNKQWILSNTTTLFIEQLKDAVQDADNLRDKLDTLSRQKQHLESKCKVTRKVRVFFSRHNPVGVAYKTYKGVKIVKSKLDAIASNHNTFRLGINHTPVIRRREETCSYSTKEIVGREDDLEKIVAKLLGTTTNVQQDVSYLTIVGAERVGKTAVAQLVYNDQRIAKEFEHKLWICVADEDERLFDLKAIVAQIVEAATGENCKGHSMDLLLRRMRESLVGKRFLVVLDDVWTENRVEWNKLVGYLAGGQRGSWVVVTSRSKATAHMVGDSSMYELQGFGL